MPVDHCSRGYLLAGAGADRVVFIMCKTGWESATRRYSCKYFRYTFLYIYNARTRGIFPRSRGAFEKSWARTFDESTEIRDTIPSGLFLWKNIEFFFCCKYLLYLGLSDVGLCCKRVFLDFMHVGVILWRYRTKGSCN